MGVGLIRIRKKHRWLKSGSAAAALVVIGLAFWAFWLEPSRLQNESRALELPDWPRECHGLRVAVLGDLHVGSPFNSLERLAEVVAQTNAAEPSLILLAGDYVIHGVLGGRFVPPEAIAEVLGKLHAPAGVFAVLGNHDWWFNGPRVTRALEAEGIPVLEDQVVRLSTGTCSFWLVGIGDFWEGDHDIAAALQPLDHADLSEPVVALTHNPDVFPDITERVSLTVAGHTHGGQVYLPLIGRLIVPSKYGKRYAIGHVVEDGRHLFVTPGIGTSILPVRFLVPPEISVLELLSKH